MSAPLLAGQAPQVAAGPGPRELTPEEMRQIEAQMPEIRARVLAEMQRALANPQFVAAVQRMAQAGASDDQNEVAVPLQLASGLLYFYGTSKIKKALLAPFGVNISVFPPKFKRYSKDEKKKLNPAKELAIGVAAVGVSAAMAYLSPPVVVEGGFRDKSFDERVAIVSTSGWQLPGPPLIEADVDDTADPASCSATLQLQAVLDGDVTGFGEFEERALSWTYPYGSYPNLGEVVPALVTMINNAVADFDGFDVGELIAQVSGAGEFQVEGPVAEFIDKLLASALYIEDTFYDRFTGWRFHTDRITCTADQCLAPDGRSHGIFEGQLSSIPGMLGYDFAYKEPIQVKEYFPPVFTGLQEHLTVYYEALEPGGVPTSLPTVGFDGSPAPGHSQLLDPTWFGLEDNCDPSPELEWDLPPFLELGIHELPVRATDRSGNVTATTITVVVRDSLPPDILQPDDVGITAPQGSSTLAFTAPGVGCVTWLCEGDPPQYVLHPPLSFDFGSLEPVIDCTVSNSLYATPEPCDGALLRVGESNTVTWTLTDPSGNGASVSQQAIVRAAGTNRIPSAQGGSYTIPNLPEGVTVALPLTAGDPDLDPLTFIVQDLPDHGDLGLTAEAVFQTRFASSGTIRRATSFLKLEAVPGNPSDLLIVADGPSHKLLIFDITTPESLYLYDMVDLGDIAPDAIQLPGAPRVVSGRSLNSVLQDLWIADFTDEGNGDPVVDEIYQDAAAPNLVVDLGTSIPAGSHGRDFHLDDWPDLSGADQSANLVVYVTGEPPLLNDAPPTFPPENLQLGFYLQSSDSGNTWTATVVNPGSSVSRTSTVWSDGTVGCTGWHDAFWSTSPPWGEIDGSHPLTPFLQDPDGAGPALPVLQDPTSLGVSSCGSSTTALILESQNNWLEAFTFQNTPGLPVTRVQNAAYPLRLTRFINLRSIEEVPGAQTPHFFVLDDTGIYQFDLAGRLGAFISFSDSSNNAMPPAQGSTWADLATDPAGHVFVLSSSNQSEAAVSFVMRLTVDPGVGNFHDNGRQGTFGGTGDRAWAVAADQSNVFALGGFGLSRCVNDLRSCTQMLATAPYRDVEIRTGTNEIFLTEISGTTQRVVRADRTDGHVIATFGQGLLDFGPGAAGSNLSGVAYGRMAYDASADRLLVSDSFLADSNDPTSRIPRVRVFSGDGTLLETIEPDASPNIFSTWLQPGDFGSVSDLAVGPGRIYVAEASPLKRLHVFDATTAYPVPCPDPTAQCRAVDYDPDANFVGADAFSYTASDPFGGTSQPAVIHLNVIQDTLPPVIACPQDLAVEVREAGGLTLTDPLEHEPNAQLRDFFSPAVTDNVDLPDPVLTHDGGSFFPVGSTTVIFTATDAAGNVSSCSAVLTVTDTTPPQFIGPNGEPVEKLPSVVTEATGVETPFSPPAPTVQDVSGIASLVHDGPATYPVGDTVITWTATDLGGNTATATQIVRVVDTTPPEFITTLPPDGLYTQVAVSGWANPLEYPRQMAFDLVGVVDVDCSPAKGDPVPTGIMTVECQAYDAAGNVGRRTFFVDVEDGDADGDGLGDLVDTEPQMTSVRFDDTPQGGSTSGEVLGGDHPLLITDGPAPNAGVEVVVTGERGPAPAEVAVCGGFLHAWLAFTTFQVEPGVTEDANDSAVLTCLPNGAEAFSELGTIETTFRLPAGGTARAVFDSGERGRLEGWVFTVPAGSTGEVAVSAGGHDVTVAPGESRDLVELVMGTSADLAATGWSDPAEVAGGQPLTLYFDIANRGPSPAPKAAVTLTVPPGLQGVVTSGCAQDPGGVPLCTVDEIAVGGVAHVILSGTVARTASSPVQVTAAARSSNYDPNPGDNQVTVSVPVTTSVRPPRVAMSFEPDTIPFLQGLSRMTLTVGNPAGEGALRGVHLEAVLPPGVVLAADPHLESSCGGTAVAAAGQGTLFLSAVELAEGGQCTVSVDVTVDPDTGRVGQATARVASGPGEAPTLAEAGLTLEAVTSFTAATPTGTGTATVRFSGGGDTCTFARAAFVDPRTVPGVAQATFPHGLLSFTATGCEPGTSLEITLSEPGKLGEDAVYWRWGPTGDDPDPHWEAVPADLLDDTAVFTLVDGGAGDGQPGADGRITHVGGPAVPAARPIPAAGPVGTAFLLLLLALAGLVLLGWRP